MELRTFAEQLLTATDLDVKLAPPESPLVDTTPGDAWRPVEPARPADLQFAPRRTAPGMPHPLALSDLHKRGVAHHIMANHELQAVEVMAFTLVAFPDAPREFRLGLTTILQEEQRHTRLHMRHAARCGVPFGSLPVNCYIWKKALDFECVLDYLAGLPLVFEGANLDHSLELEAAFLKAGDPQSAGVMRAIHNDEIGHVKFGIEWLQKLKPADATAWETFCKHLHYPLRPNKARGSQFNHNARLAAGLPEDFIDHLASLED